MGLPVIKPPEPDPLFNEWIDILTNLTPKQIPYLARWLTANGIEMTEVSVFNQSEETNG